MPKSKHIIVSNRLPISVVKQDGKLAFVPSSGGLATAMASLDDSTSDRLWIGWPGIASDDLTPADKAAITAELAGHGCHPVFLTQAQVEGFYEGYANDTIWPLFHYFQSLANYDNAYWEAYQEVNMLFCEAIVRQAAPEASIWIHDYHLLLLPKFVRAALPKSTVGFFLHIPFPSYEIFRMLPNRKVILEGLLGADLVGFHVYDYARHFLSSVLRICGLENKHGSIMAGSRTVKVDAFPIGIDYEKFVDALDDSVVQSELQAMETHYEGKQIILSMDRLDYSKGILKRLEAFEEFLRRNPATHKKVVMVVIAVPSRTEVDTYKDLRDAIEKSIGHINGVYGTVEWTPISYQFKNLAFEQVVALYARADVALITPLRDGMNLVAKEYIACKQRTPGVLILSEMTGAIDELPEALSINPNDISSIVTAIETALAMPVDEQYLHLRSMQARLSRYTVQRWAADFMEQLNKTKEYQRQQGSKILSATTEKGLVRRFKEAKQRLLLLDYDGTLREFVGNYNPQLAAPDKALLALIGQLAKLPNTRLCIVSGRPREILELWFGRLPVVLAAEHGAWVKYDGVWSQQPASLQHYKKILLPILEHYAERTPGARVEHKEVALVWHYRNVPTELAAERNASLKYELSQLLGNTDIGVYAGAKIIEIKPRMVHKGAVANDLLALHPADFTLAIGDDYTDEDMFAVMPEDSATIKVGRGDTSARFQLLHVSDVRAFLQKLI
ncbi:MAG: bifunctional alpha,alpha-trehalose-phosphate synthase (UDP-forming)/trehalose-phosphatase [Candidatus Saccharimonadales bacterium]